MSSIVKGILLIGLGVMMLGWFLYSIANPPVRGQSETYAMDWIMILLQPIGAIAGFVGGIQAVRSAARK